MMTEEEAVQSVRDLPYIARQLVVACDGRVSVGYEGMANKLRVTSAQIQYAADCLKAAKLATVRPTRRGNEYSGSALFLTDRGEMVKNAAAKLKVDDAQD